MLHERSIAQTHPLPDGLAVVATRGDVAHHTVEFDAKGGERCSGFMLNARLDPMIFW